MIKKMFCVFVLISSCMAFSSQQSRVADGIMRALGVPVEPGSRFRDPETQRLEMQLISLFIKKRNEDEERWERMKPRGKDKAEYCCPCSIQ